MGDIVKGKSFSRQRKNGGHCGKLARRACCTEDRNGKMRCVIAHRTLRTTGSSKLAGSGDALVRRTGEQGEGDQYQDTRGRVGGPLACGPAPG